MGHQYIVDLSKAGNEEVDLIGKKACELGKLPKLGIAIPRGFIVTSKFFKNFLHETGIEKDILDSEKLYHPSLRDSAERLLDPVRRKILLTHIPNSMVLDLHRYFRSLSGTFRQRSLNVFSSSFNDRSISFSNVVGDANLVLKIKTIWTMSLRESVAIVVQEGAKSAVKGKIVTNSSKIDNNLTNAQMDKLKQYCILIQKHFYFPKEIEYAVLDNKVIVTKINPFTGAISNPSKPKTDTNRKVNIRKILAKGFSLNQGIVTGHVKKLHSIDKDIRIRKGEIAVLSSLNSLGLKDMRNAKAIIIDSVLPTAHSKAIFRKLIRVPAIEGAKNSTHILQNGNVVTVNGTTGEIYSGGIQ